MFLTIDTDDPRPLYQQVVDSIKHLIAQGRLSEGAVLPSTRQLASDLGVNLNTIATAYRELQNQGLVTIKHGAGCVVTSGRTTKRKRSRLVQPLRAAIAELVLAGISPSKINEMVAQQLNAVARPIQ